MEFTLNNDIWKIKEVDSQKLLQKYNEEFDSDSTFCFGITLYPKHEIWINNSMCQEQKIKTLKHELTHAYIWEYGLYNAPSFTEEMVCDIVASCNEIITQITIKFAKEKAFLDLMHKNGKLKSNKQTH